MYMCNDYDVVCAGDGESSCDLRHNDNNNNNNNNNININIILIIAIYK